MGQIVYTGGTFDLIHSGHVRFLQACRKIAGEQGKVVVGGSILLYVGVCCCMRLSLRAYAVACRCRLLYVVVSFVGNGKVGLVADNRPWNRMWSR